MEITGLRSLVTDDGRFGLHLTKTDHETLDVVFLPQATPDLGKLRDLLLRHLPGGE